MSLFNLGGMDMSAALGAAPTGVYSGLNPAASAGAYGGNPLGGGIAGQTASDSLLSTAGGADGISPMQMMLLQQVLSSASGHGQPSQIQSNNLQPYADPVSNVTPAMLGRQMMGA